MKTILLVMPVMVSLQGVSMLLVAVRHLRSR
jgi:hypothetical protein